MRLKMPWIKFVQKFPRIWIMLLTLLTLFWGYEIKNIKVDVDIILSLPQSIPTKKFYEKRVRFFNTTPLFISQFINFGIMGFSSIPVELTTMVTTSVAIGVGVDYAIHYIHNFRWQLAKGLNYDGDMRESIRESGSPIILNALTAGLGFLVLVFFSFRGVSNMGLLISLTMFTTSIGALTILPVVFITARPKSLKKSAEVIKNEVSEKN
jgi:predicted RND superfamily exporter protein